MLLKRDRVLTAARGVSLAPLALSPLREPLLMHALSSPPTQLNGKQGVFLAHEKKVVKFADQQNDQYNALVARDADTFPEIEHRALDKRVVNLVQQWKVQPTLSALAVPGAREMSEA